MPAKMICPRCGAEMNFHAEKLVYSDSVPNPDTALGGEIQEMHSCPHCGRAESRPSLHDSASG
jgi:NMD protein affecting ribosome stability and mRNA decay